MYDAIIIGAGLSGLAAGVRLAHFGRRVLILERHYAIGGLNSYYRLDGRNYDVGLHAVTNFRPKGARSGPLPRLLRQLRLSWDDFSLAEQIGSKIVFPGTALEFSNDPALLENQVAERFPSQIDGFRKLSGELLDYDAIDTPAARESAREVVGGRISDPMLLEMLFCPILFYGGSNPHDIDFGQFSILFRSIFLEGLARPPAGIRAILKKLVRRFKDLGGELRLRSGVQRLAPETDEVRVVLDDADELSARQILSSAGWCETVRMCDDLAGDLLPGEPIAAVAGQSPGEPGDEARPPSGQLSFVESVSTLDVKPADIGHRHTIVFFNDSPKFHWQRPEEPLDVRSGVVCSPNNFAYADPASAPEEGSIRLTALANFDHWNELPEAEYTAAKQHWYERLAASAVRFISDFRSHVVAVDIFTPKTIRRFTSHDNGAVYGAPHKRFDGTTALKNVFLCGTDQGLVGIIGAMTSGILMANRLLSGQAAKT
ncbi:MAG TPA: NAD(P)/FAD-dependent oxidoreductase [Pirellulales bacterium]|jgi:phytoene dehydrogenase-like protein|nr:NAD(P)/FAD-dependent oxidoreductase [Pirellulales bacterium]